MLGQLDDNNRELEMQRMEIHRLREQVAMMAARLEEPGSVPGFPMMPGMPGMPMPQGEIALNPGIPPSLLPPMVVPTMPSGYVSAMPISKAMSAPSLAPSSNRGVHGGKRGN
jgi:hypothetical protein